MWSNKYLNLALLDSWMSSLGGGKWECNECGFRSKSTNVRYHIESKHVQSSSGYICPKCNDYFRTRNALNTHMSNKHKSYWMILDTADEFIRSKMVNLGGGKWQCAVCYHVTKSTNLYYHIESKHVQISGYTCQICHKLCKSRNSYNVHMSTYHRSK